MVVPLRRLLVPLIAVLALLTAPAAAVAGVSGTARAQNGGSNGGGSAEVSALVTGPGGRLEVQRVTARDHQQAQAVASRWRGQPGVVAADVAKRVRVTAVPPPDPSQGQQWGLNAVRAPQAWSYGDASGQVVAVVDTGVDLTHPDLASALVPGYDALSGTPGGQDLNGHGTHVAGIIAAVAGNGVGGAGVALRAKIMPVRVLDASGSGWSSDVAAGITWAVNNGATVINLSFGGTTEDTVLSQSIAYALSKGVPVVAAAGNEGDNGNPVEYPAATPGVLAVGAVDASGAHASFSNTGSYVGLVGPGVGIFSTWLGGGYAVLSGTSMAAPFVSGALAMARAADPTLSPSQLRAVLTSTAADLGTPGVDPVFGAGLVDVATATAQTYTDIRIPSRFVAVQPIRLVDTRPGTPSLVGPSAPVTAGSSLRVPGAGVLTSAGQVPADATAVVLNVTAVNPTQLTYITAYPDGVRPPDASSLNAAAGSTVPNLVTVRLGPSGAFRLRNAAGSVDLVADLAGYYVPATGNAGVGFNAVPPSRLLDTRPGFPAIAPTKGRLLGGQYLDLPVTGQAGVPADAQAVVINVTGVQASGATYVSVYPTTASSSVPNVSSLNLTAGTTHANLVTVAVGSGGQVRLRNSDAAVDLAVDVAGWYGPSGTLRLVPVPPVRLLDTRIGLGARPGPLGPGGTLDLPVAGVATVPSAATAVQLNLTGVAPTQATYLAAYPRSSTPPATSSLNLAPAETRANAATVPLGGGVVTILNSAGSVPVVADLAGWFQP